MQVNLHEIQPGWEVYEPAGKVVGSVVGVESGSVHIKTGGLMAKDFYLPPNAIAELEPHRVELNVAKDDLNGRGWERPPDETAI